MLHAIPSTEDFHCCGLVAQSCLTLCNPKACYPLGSSVHGILQSRILEWVALLQGNLPDPGTKPVSPVWAGSYFTTETPGKPTTF